MTKHFFPPLLAVFAVLALAVVPGCGGPSKDAGEGSAATDDLAIFARLGDLARRRVHQSEPGATLQQVDIAPGEGRYEFRFVDPTSSRVLIASGGGDAKTPEAFTVTTAALASLAAPPSSSPVDLAVLRLGPDGVVATVVRELGAATPRTLTLIQRDGALAWRVEVNGPRGIVRGTVQDETGQFVREDATP